MITKTFKNKLLPSLLMLSIFTTSFGGAFTVSAAAAAPESTATEESVQTGASNKGLLTAIAAVGLIAAFSGHSDSSGSTSSAGNNTGTSSATDEQQAVSLLNKDRAANGLPALKVNSRLTQLARNYAQDMITRGFFSHYNPEGLSPFARMQQAGISYKSAGENLGVNTSVAGAETAFMNSGGHRANILNASYTEVGIGVVRSSNGSLYVVQEFIGN